MANILVTPFILTSCLATAWGHAAGGGNECLAGDAEKTGISLMQNKPVRNRMHGPARTINHKIGTDGVAAIPDELLEKMVMNNPYKCEFAADDVKKLTCGKTMVEAGVHPAHLTAEGNKTFERFNALRARLPIGSLPCCATAPFCGAPSCKDEQPPVTDTRTCTKRPASENFAYMVQPEVWPAYHGNGGTFDLDVEKHWNILGRLDGARPALPPFDLFIDLGANTGLVTEKLVMRRFAKDYIMVEAIPAMTNIFQARFGNDTFRKRFVSEQTATWPGAQPWDPQFEYMNFAISDHAGGFLDTCSYNWGNWTPEDKCVSEMASVDSLIPGRLSPDFASRLAQAKSAYIKVDVEGMDQMAVQGMEQLLQEKRGDDYLVNFLMLEFCTPCMEAVRNFNGFDEYDLKSFVSTLESRGFEAFLMGPRYLPLSHGSWDDMFRDFSSSSQSSRCNAERFPKFVELYSDSFADGGKQCSFPKPNQTIFTADIFAMRASHPKAKEIKLALGACAESEDFSL